MAKTANTEKKVQRRKHKQRNNQQEIDDPNFKWKNGDEFVVERIIGKEVWDGESYYLIKWKGFSVLWSTWERSYKFTQMKNLIRDFNKSSKGRKNKTIRQDTNKLMNPYRATAIHGHFLYGDQPKEIVNEVVKFDSNGVKIVYLEVSWQPRQIATGELQQLQHSILDSDTIFEHNPQFLLNYYKKVLKVVE